MNLNNFERRNFNKGRKGYDVMEVDDFINKLLNYCHSLEKDNKALQERIANYEEEKKFINEALVTAQKTASTIESKAIEKAKHIENEAEEKSLELLKNIEDEALAYRDSVYNCFYSYERNLRLIIDHFYTLARKHMENLEKEFTTEIQNTISRFDKDYNNLPKVKPVINHKDSNNEKNSEVSSSLKEKEHSLLLGRVLNKDIVNSLGNIITKKDTVITPELIEILIGKGLYGELIEAIENNGE